jgi:hypothetical protein
VEASDGELYMADRFVKFAGGQASCSAPPQGNPQEIAANMGKMTLEALGKPAAATPVTPSARLTINHPNHTGMVLDQITLLYVPLRIVTAMEVMQGEERVLSMKGSMTLSQNPTLDFDYRSNGAETMRIFARDSDGASWEKSFPIGQGSEKSLLHPQHLDLVLRKADDVADLLAGQRTRQRRHVRDRALGRVRLVLAHDAKGLLPAARALDGHGRAEVHALVLALGRDHKLRARRPRRPVAQIARRRRRALAVLGRLRGRVLGGQPAHLGLDLGEAFARDEVRVLGDQPVRQILDDVLVLFDEGAAHATGS